MIIIEGALTASSDTVDELIRLGIEHSQRSRLEPGCISHTMTRDVENPLRLIFHERWEDMTAVTTHFAVEASGDFVRTAISLATAPPTLEIFDATATST